MARRTTPLAARNARTWSRNGLPATGASGFGTSETTDARRIPLPPARTTASIMSDPSELDVNHGAAAAQVFSVNPSSDNDDLEILEGLSQDASHRRRERGRPVVNRGDDADRGPFIGGKHDALLIRYCPGAHCREAWPRRKDRRRVRASSAGMRSPTTAQALTWRLPNRASNRAVRRSLIRPSAALRRT